MPAYKRFSDNSVQSDTSYQVFDQTVESTTESSSPQELQKEFENFKMSQQYGEKPDPHEQSELPTLVQQPSFFK